MALDWIKVRNEIHDDGAVIRIAEIVDRSENEVVGALVYVWSWADRTTDEGDLLVSVRKFDTRVGIDGFASAMQEVGWADITEEGMVTLRNYGKHNGTTAKKRAEDRIRKAVSARETPLSANLPKKSGRNAEGSRKKRGSSAEDSRKNAGRIAEETRTIEVEEEVEEESGKTKDASAADAAPLCAGVADFEQWWGLYPQRPGIPKQGKKAARKLWLALPHESVPDLMRAVRNYAEAARLGVNRLPKDAERFLAGGDDALWRGWVEWRPPPPGAIQGSANGRPARLEEMAGRSFDMFGGTGGES